MKNNCKRFLSVFLTVCMIFSSFAVHLAYANATEGCTCTPVDGVHQEGCPLYDSNATDDGTISFEAGIYFDADRQNLDCFLTSEGAELSGWNYLKDSVSAADRYLGISIDGLSMETGKQYQLVIEMAPILYINQNTDPSDGNAIVSFTQNDSIVVNTDGQYVPNKYSLSNLTYLFNEGVGGLNFSLPLRFDINLWNKQDGAELGNGEDPLLRVYLQEKQDDGSFATVGNHDVWLKQATVSGTISYYAGQVYGYIVGGSGSTVNAMKINDTLRVVFHHFATGTYNSGHYTENVRVSITIPTCTVNDTVYALSYDNAFGFLTSNGSAVHNYSYDEENGILTVEAENFYFASAKLFEIFFSAPSELASTEGKFVFTGKLTIEEDGVFVTENQSFSFTVDNSAEANLKCASTSGLADTRNPGVVHFLSAMGLANDSATTGSGPLQINLKFDVNDTNLVRVTTVNIMTDTITRTIPVTYTLMDQNGDPVTIDGQTEFTTSLSNARNIDQANKNNVYLSFAVPSEHKGYYFSSLSYGIGDLPASTAAYEKSASAGPGSAGTIWGYVVAEEVPQTMPIHTIEVYRSDGEGNTGELLLEKSSTTNIDKGNKVTYFMDNAAVTQEAVAAGDSVTISGRIRVYNYPYVSNGCLENVRLGVVLPAGVVVNEAGILATYVTGGDQLPVEEFTKQELDDGKVLYLIKFDQDRPIGFYSESLWCLDGGYMINFSIQLNSDKTISNHTLYLRETVFVAGLGLENGATHGQADKAVTDKYDLNENGKTTDKVAGFSSSPTNADYSVSVTFEKHSAKLQVTDQLTKANGESGNSLTMDSFADILNYNLYISCVEGGSANDFYYMVPIAKTSIIAELEFMQKCEVDLALKGEVTVTTSQGTAIKVLYSTTPIDGGFSDAQEIADWSDTLPLGKTWSDVTAIKVVPAESTIENGSINNVSVPLGYAGEDITYDSMAGYQIQWSSRGYYHYQLGYNSSYSTESTDGCTITLTSHQEFVQFTLTAAKNGSPTTGQNTYVLELEDEFYLAQEYRVKQISPYNVNLMGADYDFSTVTGAEANENFRINISVQNKGDETAQDAIALQADNDIVGALGENSIPVFTFTIENADALSDIITERKVALTLVGSNGVIVPIEIMINRELAAAEPTTPAIVGGAIYLPFEASESTTISNDSAFTAQFVTEYVPANYTDYAIVFGEPLVSGTTITMIDWTDPSEAKYYHHTMDGSTTTLYLTAFQAMGSGSAFEEFSATDEVMERLLFIVSFPNEGESNRENTMKLTKRFRDSETSEESTALTFTTVQKREFSLTASTDSAMCGDEFVISYTSECSTTDSRYTGRNLSLVVEPSGDISLPVDARLIVDGTSYYLNAQGAFLIPLHSVQMGDGFATISYYSERTSQLTMQVALWASATANGSKPMMGNQVVGPATVSMRAKTAPSFEVVSMSDRLLEPDDLSGSVFVGFEKENATNVTIEIQKKVGVDYVTQTAVLESVNGETTADAGQGVFTVTDTYLAMKLSNSTGVGTYRLLFTVSNDYATIEVPYKFVVVD